MPNPLLAISPLDGRYENKVDELRDYFSEFALFKYRLHAEVEWLIFLCNSVMLKGTKKLKERDIKELQSLVENFDGVGANRIKKLEKTTKHDVKALEYFIRENTSSNKTLRANSAFIHFGCTSEDINNTAVSMMVRDFTKHVYFPVMTGVVMDLYKIGKTYASVSMMSRTHGQPASPTTLGKEFINFVARLEDQMELLKSIPSRGKWNGASGNWNAHSSAYPKIDWVKVNERFLKKLGLEPALYSTQILPYDTLVTRFDNVARINSILIDLCRDVWAYIGLNYFKLRKSKGQVGSSTMPHKVNPIDFENAEGNLGVANSLFNHFAQKLPISRLQRDLSDSTVLRNTGVAFGHSILAYKSLLTGLQKLECNKDVLAQDLNNHWELLAEPIQTVLRSQGVEGAYEKLQALSQGKKVERESVAKFIDSLDLDSKEKDRLKKMKPGNYIGFAKKMVQAYKPRFKK